MEDILVRCTSKRSYRPELLAAIVGDSARREQLLEVLRKEPPAEHEFLKMATWKRLYAKAEAEAEVAAAATAAEENPKAAAACGAD